MRPLEDIRVVAVEQYGAGPFGSLHLADLGADVIKIEDPTSGGDVSRYVPPYQDGEDSLFFETFNRGKRSLSLDLRSPQGREVFEKLVATADAVYSNLRGDVPAKLGINYADLSEINPRIVCVSLSGFGSEGPDAARPGYDYMFQALAGWMSLTGDPSGPPTKSGLSLVDFAGGTVAAFTLLAAVPAARRDGKRMDCDLSLKDVALSMLTYDATWALNGDWQPSRRERSAHPSLVPFQAFRGSDGSWFVVACAKEKFWGLLVTTIADDRLSSPDYADFAARRANREALVALLDEVFDRRPMAEWVTLLDQAGVPVAPVRTVPEALSELEAGAGHMLVDVPHETFGQVRQLRTAARVGPIPTQPRRAPRRGEHGREILGELGYGSVEIEALMEEGRLGQRDL